MLHESFYKEHGTHGKNTNIKYPVCLSVKHELNYGAIKFWFTTTENGMVYYEILEYSLYTFNFAQTVTLEHI